MGSQGTAFIYLFIFLIITCKEEKWLLKSHDLAQTWCPLQDRDVLLSEISLMHSYSIHKHFFLFGCQFLPVEGCEKE